MAQPEGVGKGAEIAIKLKRGTFTAIFSPACIAALGPEQVVLEEIKFSWAICMRQAQVLGALLIFGLVVFMAYVLLANSRCELESPQSLNWTVAPRSEPQKESQTNQNAKGGKNSKSRATGSASPPSYSVTQENPANDKADHAQQKGSGWLTKFFCDAKISDLVIAFFSYVLAVATGWLGWATIGLWRASSDEFAATHRPKIRIKHLWLASDIWQ
jgi:hypothetical protein